MIRYVTYGTVNHNGPGSLGNHARAGRFPRTERRIFMHHNMATVRFSSARNDPFVHTINREMLTTP